MPAYSNRKELARLTKHELLAELRTRTLAEVRNLHVIAEQGGGYWCLDLNRRFQAKTAAELIPLLVEALGQLSTREVLPAAPDRDWDYLLRDDVDSERLVFEYSPWGGRGSFISVTVHRLAGG